MTDKALLITEKLKLIIKYVELRDEAIKEAAKPYDTSIRILEAQIYYLETGELPEPMKTESEEFLKSLNKIK